MARRRAVKADELVFSPCGNRARSCSDAENQSHDGVAFVA